MSAVVNYRNNELQCFCQIKFDTGERVLVSIATFPTPSVKIFRLALGGFLPRQTIWEYNPTMAGGYNAYVENLMKMFRPAGDEPAHPLDVIRDTLLPCSSLEEARRTLLNCESQASERAPQQPDRSKPFDEALLSKPFDEALLNFANRLRAECGFNKCEGVADAAAIVLTDVATSVLTGAGPEHLPHPTAFSTANASVGACFMAACLTGIAIRLSELGIELDVRDVLVRAGFAVFQMYTEQDQAEIISAGGNTFESLVAEASSRENVRTWVEGVQTLTAAYVLTEDKAWITQLAKLYGTLAALASSREQAV